MWTYRLGQWLKLWHRSQLVFLCFLVGLLLGCVLLLLIRVDRAESIIGQYETLVTPAFPADFQPAVIMILTNSAGVLVFSNYFPYHK